jgi:hypothetical protein
MSCAQEPDKTGEGAYGIGTYIHWLVDQELDIICPGLPPPLIALSYEGRKISF